MDGGRREHVADAEVLWRRYSERDLVPDEQGQPRLSSALFRTHTMDGIAVHRAAKTDISTVLAAQPGCGIAELTAAEVRAVEPLDVIPDPVLNALGKVDDPSHALIVPLPTKGQARALARATRIIRMPD